MERQEKNKNEGDEDIWAAPTIIIIIIQVLSDRPLSVISAGQYLTLVRVLMQVLQ